MAFVYAINASTPLATDLVSLGDDQIRDLKAAIRERVNSFFVNIDTDPWAGKDGAVLGNTTVKVLTPVADNTYALGTGALRFSDLRVHTATLTGTLTGVAANFSGALTAASLSVTGQYGPDAAYALADGATIAIDWNNSNVQTVVLGGTGRTVTSANMISGGRYLFSITEDGTGSRTITTWPAAWDWTGGSAPTLTTTAGKTDTVALYHNGTKIIASFVANA